MVFDKMAPICLLFTVTFTVTSEYLTPDYWTVWVSGIQMVKSCDLADHSKTGHFGPKTGFFSPVFRPPFYRLNTQLVRYSDGYCTFVLSH